MASSAKSCFSEFSSIAPCNSSTRFINSRRSKETLPMPAIDAGLVFLPRYTTLVGAAEFTTAPLDVSGQAGTQFQVWRGPIRASGGSPAFTLYLEESLDAATWALGPSTPQAFTIAENATVFFAYSFRLRWFRLRVVVAGTNPMVSCWAEGILRAGD